jgi:CRISPR-associated protein (TIGR02584 family)
MNKRKPEISKDTILFAVTGMTPAVLTETVWALAHETTAVVPDRVVVVTTSTGRNQIGVELFGKEGVWDSLRKAVKAGSRLQFGTTASDIRIFTAQDPGTGRTVELDDLRTASDNAAAADFILEQLRGFAENPDTRIIASIAGGRKTMGALLYACMSLIGREGDRLTHVLVNEPFDNPKLIPKFYFPGFGLSNEAGKGKGPIVELADLPFVPLRNRFKDLDDMPGSFKALVGRYSRQLNTDRKHKPVVRLDVASRTVTVDYVTTELRTRAFDTLRFLMHINKSGEIPKGQLEAETPFKVFLGEHTGWSPDSDDIKRELSYIRNVFTRAGITWLPGKRHHSLQLPPWK